MESVIYYMHNLLQKNHATCIRNQYLHQEGLNDKLKTIDFPYIEEDSSKVNLTVHKNKKIIYQAE